MRLRVVMLTAVALSCFAGNSILCRLALGERQIDAVSFTTVRIVSGAIVLALLAARRGRGDVAESARWISAVALFAYAAPFSYAYLQLGAAVGALILFGLVQVTMVGWGLVQGERPGALAWGGIAVAVAGLVGLTLPGRSAPDLRGAAAMAVAGIAWGVYSLRGRVSRGDPLVATSSAFVRAAPLVAVLAAVAAPRSGLHASARGIALAAASGALASGLGYAVWYAALRHLSTTRAAVLQLLVPILAAGGAVAFLSEPVSLRLVLASAAILGGVGLTIRDRASAKGR